MTMLFIELALMLVIILIASELFTNALEHLGERLGISEGVTGSLFAAVGTALPETTVPIIALLGGTPSRAVNEEIGVGAILGAPLMLATLSTCLMTVAILKSRGLHGRIMPERSGFVRDLNFFLIAFLIACAAMFVPHHAWQVRAMFAVGLVALYIVYVIATFRASAQLVEGGHGTEAPEALFASRLGLRTSFGSIMLQFVVGIALLVGGAKGFIHGVEGVSQALGISALLLSLIIIPIATELPEKVNSILWARRGRTRSRSATLPARWSFRGRCCRRSASC